MVRDIWQKTSIRRGGNYGLATIPIQLTADGVKKSIDDALWTSGIRVTPSKQHEFKECHGLRKYFKTYAQHTMEETDVERLLGHSGGWSNAAYNRPPDDWLINEYLKAVPDLTIHKPVEQTQAIARELSAQMVSNDQEIRALREQNQIMGEQLAAVIEQQQQHADTFDMKLAKLLEIVKTASVDQDEATSGEIVKMMPRKLTTKELQKIEAHRNLTGVFIDSTDSKGSLNNQV